MIQRADDAITANPDTPSQTAPRPKRRPRSFPVKGTPFQVEQRRRSIETRLRRHANMLRSDAARLDRLAARMERDRIAGKPISATDMCAVVHATGYATYPLAQLVGVKTSATREQLLNTIIDISGGRTPRSFAAVDSVPTSAPDAAASKPPAPAATQDALSAATAIVRSASGTAIDWTREPLTEREGKIRTKLLKWVVERSRESLLSLLLRALRFEDIGVLGGAGFYHRDSADHLAPDVRATWILLFDEAEASKTKDLAERRRQAIEDAIEEVDNDG